MDVTRSDSGNGLRLLDSVAIAKKQRLHGRVALTTRKIGLLLIVATLGNVAPSTRAEGIITQLLVEQHLVGQVRSLTDRRTAERLLKGGAPGIDCWQSGAGGMVRSAS